MAAASRGDRRCKDLGEAKRLVRLVRVMAGRVGDEVRGYLHSSILQFLLINKSISSLQDNLQIYTLKCSNM